MKKLTIIITICITLLSCGKMEVKNVCPKCGEVDCIYQQINDNVKGEGTDQEILKSIFEVCKKRNIKDSSTIELLLKEYYL